MSERDQIVEAVTREVLAALTGSASGQATNDRCADCTGCCAATCSDKARAVLKAGAGRVSYHGAGADVPGDLAGFIDHTLLKPEASAADIDKICDEAVQYHFAAVCVNGYWTRRVARHLKGSGVLTATVVGFPLGSMSPRIKAQETRQALRDGAREIDMVLNIGALKSGDYELVEQDIRGVVDACREVGAVCKVILETALLTDEEKVIACGLSKAAKAHYVKTSTGFSKGGATVFDVALMRETVGPNMGVKASGGVRSADDAHQMIAVGATRIGASAGVADDDRRQIRWAILTCAPMSFSTACNRSTQLFSRRSPRGSCP